MAFAAMSSTLCIDEDLDYFCCNGIVGARLRRYGRMGPDPDAVVSFIRVTMSLLAWESEFRRAKL